MWKAILDRPYYVFRPSQALRRVGQMLNSRAPKAEFREAKLPWGLRLRFRPHDHIGQFIHNYGLYDLGVSEMLYRLAESGETDVDIGANIGYMTSILAARTRKQGAVHAFEPHPDIFAELSANAALWHDHPGAGSVHLHQVALSDCSGNGHLQVTGEFEHNRGTASLSEADQPSVEATKTYLVPLRRLDDILSSAERIGVMKLDVEGHELRVVKGADRLLTARSIRDIVFEDYGAPPTPVMQLLESYGYKLFSVRQRFFGLKVAQITPCVVETQVGPPNYLATCQAERALIRLRKPGWAIFRLCWL